MADPFREKAACIASVDDISSPSDDLRTPWECSSDPVAQRRQSIPSNQNWAAPTSMNGSQDSQHDSLSSREVFEDGIQETKQDFRPEYLDSKTAAGMGYPTEHTLPANSTNSSESSEDLEKGIVAPILVQQGLGARTFEKGNVMPIPKQQGHSSQTSYSSAWRISLPPAEMPRLPSKHERPVWRRIRYKLYPVYQRLFSIVFIANMIAMTILLVKDRHRQPPGPSPSAAATAAASNILGAFLIRQENVINILYAICCSTPHWVPLRVRRTIAKLYHFGGVHSGCAISAVCWFIVFTALVTRDFANGNFNEPAIIAITYTLLFLFISICVFAIPGLRVFSHNTFEAVHRFAGWTSVGLFWALILLFARAESKTPNGDSLGLSLVKLPAFWILVVITFFTILPWLRLRKVEAFPEVLSNHAVRIHFNYMKLGPMLGLRIAHNPLKEWHAFAGLPEADGSSFSLIVSDAGDWTKKQIMEPRKHYWVRGIPITGVLRMSTLFKRVVIVTTGSGIGPVLSILISNPNFPCRLLWSTPNPIQTYGEGLVELVGKADPDAMIINTRASGRPDMVALTYHLFLEFDAEAVFVISNPHLTRKVVYGMESRGIPAYGPIWDS